LKSEKGITMVTLVITIVVMLIIAGIAVTAGNDSIKNTKKTAFITELEIIQEKVNTIYEKRKLNEEDVEYYNLSGKDISYVDKSILAKVLNGTSQNGYRYFSQNDLEQLDLSDISQDVIINFDTRDVVSLKGIEIDGKTYYRLSDIPGYTGQDIEYVNKNTLAPSFNVEINVLSNSWQLVLKDIVYNSNVASGTVSYKLHSDTNWIIVGDKTYFEVSDTRFI
jgi:Tfp pilus assembly protein PilE